jgi:hypothetical protein
MSAPKKTMWRPETPNITYVGKPKRALQEDPPLKRVGHNPPLKVLRVDVSCGVVRTILHLLPAEPKKQQPGNQEPKDKPQAVATTEDTNQRPLDPCGDDELAMFVRSPPSESQE